jgi:RNA polymerase sigma factor (sigma-70 family)
VSGTDSTTAIETVFRLEFPRLVAGLARYVGDVGLAEELAQDSLVDALHQWPEEGTPRNPGAWLMAVGKRKAVDRFRRDANLSRKYAQIGRDLETEPIARDAEVDPDTMEDDRLRLIFVACHPILPVSARVAFTLRLLGGLTTAEIARAYLLSEATIAQRIVRAKKTIRAAEVPFEVPTGADRSARLNSVLEVIYLIYNEGYSASAGDDWLRPELCTEALRLGRVLAVLAPDESEVHGLVALMEIQSSRLQARIGPSGEPVLLMDQDRRRWDRLLIDRGYAALNRSEQLSASPGPYALQAEIAACHARALRPEDTDWVTIAELYRLLAEMTPSPIIELNRAVALTMAYGPALGLDLVDQLRATNALNSYHLLYSVRGDLLDKLGRHAEAHAEFERAASMAVNQTARRLSLRRAKASAEAASP